MPSSSSYRADKKLSALVDQLLVSQATVQAEIHTLRLLLATLLAESTIDGMSFSTWYDETRKDKLLHLLGCIEDISPEYAVQLEALANRKNDTDQKSAPPDPQGNPPPPPTRPPA